MIGKLVTDPFVETVRHGKAKALFAEVELPNGDVKTVQLFPGADTDTWPLKDDIVVVERAGPVGAFLYAVAAWDGEKPALKPGEREVYSRNKNRKRVTRIRMDQEGNITVDADKNVDTKAGGDISSKAGGKFYLGNSAEDLKGILLGIIDLIDGHTDLMGHVTNPIYILLQTGPFRSRIDALFK